MAELDKAEATREAHNSLDAESEKASLTQTFNEGQNLVAEIGVALKIMQLLGQVAKNFPGSLSGDVKKSIVEECYGVGLRTLAELFALVEDTNDDWVASVVETLRSSEQRLDEETLTQRTRDSVYGLIHLLTFGIVRRIALAVGASDLDKVYDVLLDENPTPAVALVSAALTLDLSRQIPTDDVMRLYDELSDNPLAQSVLRGLVINFFHLMDVRFATKQKLCEKLDINYKRLPSGGARKGARRD